MDSESPPRKKMKQARLPFQILSPKDSVPDPKSQAPSRKRHLSEDPQEDDIVVLKVGKKSEDTKENETVVTPPTEAELDNKDQVPSNGDKSETLQDAPVKETNVSSNVESKSELPNFLMNMKSNLADLLGKKVIDLSSDVGSCDCGCEDDDSAGSALEEYYEHCKKQNGTPKSTEKKPKRKSGHKTDSKKSSPAKSKSPKGKTKVSNSPKSASKTVTLEKVTDDVPVAESKSPSKSVATQKSKILSKKAQDMFAKWRKPAESSQKNENSAEVNDKVSKDDKNVNGATSPIKKNTEDLKEKVPDSKEESIPSTDEQSPKKLKLSEASDIKNEKSELKDAVQSQESEEGLVELSDSSFEETTPQKRKKSEPTSTFTGILKNIDDAGGSETPSVIDDEKTLTLTPTGLAKTPQRRLTPKQIERQKEVARKQEEKEKQRLERENEKKRLKLEKEEQKKKEKEEKEEQRRKEKEEKEKKKQAEQDLKNEEKKKKELQKAEEKRKKDEDKKKAEEEEERKKAKASALFTSFFVPKSAKVESEDPPAPKETVQNFMPFEVKADMRVAPHVRHALTSSQKECLDEVVNKDLSKPKDCLYLAVLKSGESIPKTGTKTWPLDDNKDDEDDISIIESDDAGVLVSDSKKVEKMRAKYLMFHENHRPAYRGTWRKKSSIISGRHPFKLEKIFDYEVDSADEWEEEEPGESLHGSDDEKDKESEDEYEVDNSIFVPHGYLSDDEGDAEESEEIFSPETQKAKLKLLGEEFEAQMKSKTSTLKPIIIVLTAALQASTCSARYQKLLERRAVWQEDEGPIALTQIKSDGDNGDGLTQNTESNAVTFSSGPGAKKKIISEEAIPALVTLVHGNQNKRVFLTNEFSEFLKKSRGSDNNDENPPATETAEFPRPSTPSTSGPNPLVQKWPGLPTASRISISNKIKELAVWGPCPEEGPFYGRQCWYVTEEVRTKYGVTDLKVPNTVWHYTLKPKVHNYSSSPSSAVVSNPISSTDRRTLITNFTKVMTPEEKKRQWESMKSPAATTPSSSKPLGTKGSTGKITSFTQVTTPGSVDSKCQTSATKAAVTPSSNQPQAKKRVALLVSVPRGQQITSSSHCSLLSKFEASASPKPPAVVAATSSEPSVSSQASSETPVSKVNDECIVLD